MEGKRGKRDKEAVGTGRCGCCVYVYRCLCSTGACLVSTPDEASGALPPLYMSTSL